MMRPLGNMAAPGSGLDSGQLGASGVGLGNASRRKLKLKQALQRQSQQLLQRVRMRRAGEGNADGDQAGQQASTQPRSSSHCVVGATT